MPTISLIIPTYNEAKNLPLLLEEMAPILSRESVEFIVVDDNSPDGTADIAEKLKYLYPLRVIKRSGKLGLGSAVRAGFEEAKGEYLGVIDADLSHNPIILPRMIQALREGADIAIGSRFGDTSQVEGWVWWRKLTSVFGVGAAKILTGTEDPLSGFFLVKRNVITGCSLTTSGYKILLEILVKGNYTVVKEFSFTFRMRKHSTSKLNPKEYILFASQLIQYGGWIVWYKYRALLALLGIVLCLTIVSMTQSVWLDESLSWSFAQDPLQTIVHRSATSDLHPPFYYAILHSLFLVGGASVALFRGVSVVMALLFTTVLYLQLKKAFPEAKERILAIGVAFTTISPFIIYYGSELRSTMLVIFLTLIQWIYFMRALRSRWDNFRENILFSIWSLLLLYTYYPIFFVLLAECIYVLWKKIPWKKILATFGIITAGYLPWVLFVILQRLGESPGHFLPIPWWQIPAIIAVGFVGGRVGILDMNHVHWYWPTALIAAATLCSVFYLIKAWSYARTYVQPLIAVGGVAFGLAILASICLFPLFDPRYHAELYPFFSLVVGAGVVVYGTKNPRRVAISFVAVGMIYGVLLCLSFFYTQFGRETWRQTVRELEIYAQTSDLVLFHGYEGSEPPPAFSLYTTTPRHVAATYPSFPLPMYDEKMIQHVKDIISTHNRIWVSQFLARQKDPEQRVDALFREQCSFVRSVGSFKVVFDLYECP